MLLWWEIRTNVERLEGAVSPAVGVGVLLRGGGRGRGPGDSVSQQLCGTVRGRGRTGVGSKDQDGGPGCPDRHSTSASLLSNGEDDSQKAGSTVTNRPETPTSVTFFPREQKSVQGGFDSEFGSQRGPLGVVLITSLGDTKEEAEREVIPRVS